MKIPNYTQRSAFGVADGAVYTYRAGAAYVRQKATPTAERGYRSAMGFMRYFKRRPRRLKMRTAICCYCGVAANDKPAVATAVNSAGGFIDTKRLSAPHCKNCGTMVA